MSIEQAILALAESINNLAGSYASAIGALDARNQEAEPASGEAPKRRGRPPKATTGTAADVSEPNSSEDTGSAAPGSTSDAGKAAPQSGATTVVDAGTGQAVQVEPNAPTVDRAAVKVKAAKLAAAKDGAAALTALLHKHSGIPVGEAVKFGNVPDASIAVFEADVDAALSMAD